MRIAIRGGHNKVRTGASALLNELEENRKIYPIVKKYLEMGGAEVLDVTPSDTDGKELENGVTAANNYGADLFVSIHLNKAYNSYNGVIGSEVCVYNPFTEAQRVADKLGGLGFKNRGQKQRQDLYELKNTKMKSMIIEVCFIEATGDVELYNKLGVEAIGKAIAEAILNKTIEEPKPQPPTEDKPQGELFYRVVVASYKDKSNAEKLVNELKGKGYKDSFVTAFYK